MRFYIIYKYVSIINIEFAISIMSIHQLNEIITNGD